MKRREAIPLGLGRYNTGKPCKRGHLDDRTTMDGQCVACTRLKDAHRKRDPKRRPTYLAREARRREKHRERFRLEAKARKQKRRAISRGCTGSHTAAELRAILAAQERQMRLLPG